MLNKFPTDKISGTKNALFLCHEHQQEVLQQEVLKFTWKLTWKQIF